MEKLFLNVEEIAEACGCSKQKAYLIIRQANEELKAKGCLTQMGKLPRKYFFEMIYGESKMAQLTVRSERLLDF